MLFLVLPWAWDTFQQLVMTRFNFMQYTKYKRVSRSINTPGLISENSDLATVQSSVVEL